ncbi:hypothetical protein BDF22DRAFT_690538 [Syncephalis plumigaleata]|nr:hypothetical protein BDF22DRAFT_690538 [Syncephalis plumigaleata]
MPVDPNYERLGVAWIANATQFFGIPLHPLGELPIVDFVLEDPHDISLIRERMVGIKHQLVFSVVFGYIFAYNATLAIRMVIARPRILSGWLCLIPCITGILWALVIMSAALLPHGPPCRMAAWCATFGITISTLCNSFIILQKAYLVLLRRQWVMTLGVLFMTPQFSIIVIVVTLCPITVEATAGCAFSYPAFVPWLWILLSTPINTLFSAVFCYIAYKQYTVFGADAWKRLVSDGIRAMCLAVLCNVVCGMVIMFAVSGDFSEMFFFIDWLIISVILTHHCYAMRNAICLSHRPKTLYILEI